MSRFLDRLKTAIIDLGMGWRGPAADSISGETEAHLPAALLAGLANQLADRYAIEQEIGSGGMALVFRGRDLKHERTVAVKVLRPELASQLGRERFLREIKLAARLSHPHILPLYDSGEAAGLLYFVMPLVEGMSLRERLRREGRLPVDEALEIVRAVGAALEYAHRNGIVHRDIKPENIMLHEGVAMVSDFGIGKALSAAGAEQLTQTGATLGTPAYMSPEQLYGEEIDGRSDVYSLGCVLYEMLTGQRLFEGPSPQALLARRAATPRPLLAFTEEIPERVRAAVEMTLAQDPGQRLAIGELTKTLAGTVSTPEPQLTPRPAERATPAEKSIAVLPFASMSTDPENEYLSDGITEEIINALAQLGGLRVAARTSSFAYKGKALSIGEVGATLGVSTVLEGSVRRAGDRLRVTVQLINVADGYHLWSERYDRRLDDVFAVQDEIATTIADRMKVALASGPGGLLIKPPTRNLEAYQLYLKGRHLWNRRTKDGLKQAVEYFQRAIELDPDYALAYSGLADAYLLLGSYVFMPPAEAHVRAKAAAERALELDEGLAEAHTSRGQVLRWKLDWRGEEQEYQRAIELNPNYATAHQWYATLLAALGRSEEALREIRRAEELDPLSHAISVTVARVLFLARDFEGAIRQLEKTLELEPDFMSAHAWLAIVYLEMARYDEAAERFRRAGELTHDYAHPSLPLAYVYARAGEREKALEALEQAGHAEPQGAEAAELLAGVYVALGELGRAFEWIERAFEKAPSALFEIKVHPAYDAVRSDPRFHALLQRMNFPE